MKSRRTSLFFFGRSCALYKMGFRLPTALDSVGSVRMKWFAGKIIDQSPNRSNNRNLFSVRAVGPQKRNVEAKTKRERRKNWRREKRAQKINK